MDKLELKDKVRLLMFYDNKKSLLENKMLINEQSVVGAPNYETMDQKKDVLSKNDNSYPKYCRYPERAIIPGKNEVGVSGIEAIPEGYCCYPSPLPLSEKGGTTTIFIPYDAEVTFWNEVNFDFFLKRHIEKNNYPAGYEKGLTKHYLKIFPFGTVHSFKISGLTYTSWLTYPNNSEFGVFKWFYNNNSLKPYPKIKFKDPRDDYDRIVDDYGDVAQWVSALGFLVAGFFMGGSPWLLVAELVTEGTLGIITAQRRLEKGEGLSAAFDLIFGMTPFMKTGIFSGIASEAVIKLISSMRRAGLTKTSTPEEIITWYRGLTEAEQKTWSKIVRAGDQFSEAKLKNLLEEGFDNLKTYLKENPNSIKNIKFYENVNLREFAITGIIGLVDILVETFYGSKLNDEEKGKLNKIYNNASQISEELGEEVKMNFIYNSDKIKEILKSEPTNKFLKELDLMPEGPPNADWFNTNLKDSIESPGGNYVENPSDNSKPIEDVNTSQDEITKYESEGYKKNIEMSDDEWRVAKNPIKLNGVWYYKVR